MGGRRVRTAGDVARGVGALLLLAALLAGIPALLLSVVGLPHGLPSAAVLRGYLTRPDDGTVFIAAAATIAWAGWAVFALSTAVETARRRPRPALAATRPRRGAAARRAPGLRRRRARCGHRGPDPGRVPGPTRSGRPLHPAGPGPGGSAGGHDAGRGGQRGGGTHRANRRRDGAGRSSWRLGTRCGHSPSGTPATRWAGGRSPRRTTAGRSPTAGGSLTRTGSTPAGGCSSPHRGRPRRLLGRPCRESPPPGSARPTPGRIRHPGTRRPPAPRRRLQRRQPLSPPRSRRPTPAGMPPPPGRRRPQRRGRPGPLTGRSCR